MNTRFSLVVPNISAESGESLAIDIGRRLVQDECVMSRFDPDAEVATINRLPARRRLPLSDRLFAILSDCRAHWIRTHGAFDVTLGATNDNWRSGGRGPGASAPGGWDQVDLDADRRTIAFAQAGVRIDLGGVGKGIALQGVAGRIAAAGIDHAFVSFGDSSILIIGPQPGGAAWRIGIRDEGEPAASLHAFDLYGGSVSTSGIDPIRPHLIEPTARRAPRGWRMLSVACACPVEAEVLSTALIVRPAKERAAILANYPSVQAVEFRRRTEGGPVAAKKVWFHGI
ncbi:FAD:protein FMN transferase [Sphingomonas sp. Leaf25]|uniref:FAD:protein FMN transferase n=1 Tax=Sphingomonas sp. Leaf25 TaxID=1735692 RepID=UPI0012E279BE|nr:FAD:protein FMN transferase [Sphingomonas sp. Leaf25]